MLEISYLKPTPMGYMPRVCVLGVKKGPVHRVHAYVLKTLKVQKGNFLKT